MQQLLSTIFTETGVQQLASRTLIATRTSSSRLEGPSSSAHTSSSNAARQRVRMKVGISAAELSEPLRAVVPDVFDELERQQVKRSLEEFQHTPLQTTTTVEEKEEDKRDDDKHSMSSLLDASTDVSSHDSVVAPYSSAQQKTDNIVRMSHPISPSYSTPSLTTGINPITTS